MRTLDLRGNEQVATLSEAVEYAAFLGYDHVLWWSEVPRPVEPDCFKHRDFVYNRLLDIHQIREFEQKHL